MLVGLWGLAAAGQIHAQRQGWQAARHCLTGVSIFVLLYTFPGCRTGGKRTAAVVVPPPSIESVHLRTLREERARLEAAARAAEEELQKIRAEITRLKDELSLKQNDLAIQKAELEKSRAGMAQTEQALLATAHEKFELQCRSVSGHKAISELMVGWERLRKEADAIVAIRKFQSDVEAALKILAQEANERGRAAKAARDHGKALYNQVADLKRQEQAAAGEVEKLRQEADAIIRLIPAHRAQIATLGNTIASKRMEAGKLKRKRAQLEEEALLAAKGLENEGKHIAKLQEGLNVIREALNDPSKKP